MMWRNLIFWNSIDASCVMFAENTRMFVSSTFRRLINTFGEFYDMPRCSYISWDFIIFSPTSQCGVFFFVISTQIVAKSSKCDNLYWASLTHGFVSYLIFVYLCFVISLLWENGEYFNSYRTKRVSTCAILASVEVFQLNTVTLSVGNSELVVQSFAWICSPFKPAIPHFRYVIFRKNKLCERSSYRWKLLRVNFQAMRWEWRIPHSSFQLFHERWCHCRL